MKINNLALLPCVCYAWWIISVIRQIGSRCRRARQSGSSRIRSCNLNITGLPGTVPHQYRQPALCKVDSRHPVDPIIDSRFPTITYPFIHNNVRSGSWSSRGSCWNFGIVSRSCGCRYTGNTRRSRLLVVFPSEKRWLVIIVWCGRHQKLLHRVRITRIRTTSFTIAFYGTICDYIEYVYGRALH